MFYISPFLFFNPQPLISFFFGDSQKDTEARAAHRGLMSTGAHLASRPRPWRQLLPPKPSPGVFQSGWRPFGSEGQAPGVGSRGWASALAAFHAALGGTARVVESGGGTVPRAGPRGRGPRGSLGEGQHLLSAGGPPHTPALQHLPAASDEVRGPSSTARSSEPCRAPAPSTTHPLFSCPEYPACPGPELLLGVWVPHSLGLKSTASSFSTWPALAPASRSGPASPPQRP